MGLKEGEYIQRFTNYPNQIIKTNKKEFGLHPTQKPVELFEYLIKTYTNEGETVLDNCMGSGTTAVACINTNRNFIGFELDKHYCEIANERIQKALAEKRISETTSNQIELPEIERNVPQKQFDWLDELLEWVSEMAIKLLIGGSPCTHWSIAQKNNRETEPSGMG